MENKRRKTRKESDEEYCWLPAGAPLPESSSPDNAIWIADWEDTSFIEDMYAKFPTPDMPQFLSYSKPDMKSIDFTKN